MSLSESAPPAAIPDERRYVAVAKVLKEGILGGAYGIGALLPPERELAERFAVSRQTVRAALRLLREERLVTSRQGAGTIVARPRSSEAFRLAAKSIDDLVAYAAHETCPLIENGGPISANATHY